jgi:hypothetical protein
MGLTENNPGDDEINIVRDLFTALKDTVDLKVRAWGLDMQQSHKSRLLSNHLLLNDKGFTMPQLLESLEAAELELISMVDWRNWDWRELFNEPDNLPAFLAIGLENLDMAEQLCFYDLVQPNKRLLDFWCGHPQAEAVSEGTDWRDLDPAQVTVHLHPCLKSDAFRQAVSDANALNPINLGDFFDFLVKDGWLDRTLASALIVPLFEAPRSFAFLIDRWLQVRPLDPVTLQAWDRSTVKNMMQSALSDQERLGIIMLEYS